MTSKELSILSTKLANQRTYLAYMRTYFGISALAGTFHKRWIFAFGLAMILGSTLQYIQINENIQNQINPNNDLLICYR